MKIPRKTAALLLAPVLALSLTACGGGEPAQDEGGAQAAGIAVQVETVVQDTIATENKVSGKISADNEAVIMIASTAKCTAVYFEAGDQVEAGDLLGTVGTSAISESASPSHLHFELVEYGVSIDPLHYLEQE